MINNTRIIKNYVISLYQVSQEENLEKILFDQICFINDILNKNLVLVNILKVPTINKLEKKKIIDEIFENKINVYIINFIKILIDNNRIEFIFKIIDEYKNLYYKKNNIKLIKITSAVDLSELEKRDVISRCEKLFNNKIVASFIVDKTIIGGVIIEADDKLYDMSVSNKLSEIKKLISERVI